MNFAPHSTRKLGAHHLASVAIVAVFVFAFVAVSAVSTTCESQKARQYGSLGQYVPEQVLVKFADGVTESDARAAIATTGYAIKQVNSGATGTVYALAVPAGQQLSALCGLMRDDRVFFATLERKG